MLYFFSPYVHWLLENKKCKIGCLYLSTSASQLASAQHKTGLSIHLTVLNHLCSIYLISDFVPKA